MISECVLGKELMPSAMPALQLRTVSLPLLLLSRLFRCFIVSLHQKTKALIEFTINSVLV